MHETLLEEILTNVIRIKLYRQPRSLGTQDEGVKLFSGTQISSICFFSDRMDWVGFCVSFLK